MEGVAEAKGLVGTASRFISHYWPLSLVVVALLLGFIALIAYLLAAELCCADDGAAEEELAELDAAAASVQKVQAAAAAADGRKAKPGRAKKDD